MKSTLMAAMLLLTLVSPIQAEEEPEITTDLWCESIETLATIALVKKYNRVPLSEALPQPDVEIYRLIVLDAYKQPVFSGYDRIEQHIRGFATTWAVACHEANS